MDVGELEEPNKPWEETREGKRFLTWFAEYRKSVAILKPVAPGMKYGNMNEVVSYLWALTFSDVNRCGIWRRRGTKKKDTTLTTNNDS